MPGLLDRLNTGCILLADGPWGSCFIAQGLQVAREPADVWNLRHPDRVARLARDYSDSGAEILTTNTFGANRVRLARFGLEGLLRAINTQGVAIARDHANPGALLAGAMGPARGPGQKHPEDAELFDIFQEQAACLAAAGASFLLLETMTDLAEARIAIRAARTACTLDVICSFAVHESVAGAFETWAGDTVEKALGTALETGASMTGANCFPATESVVPLIQDMRRFVGSKPLWLKLNAGQPDLGGGLPAYPCPFAVAPLERIVDALGCGMVGGCCGATPVDIARLRRILEVRGRAR